MAISFQIDNNFFLQGHAMNDFVDLSIFGIGIGFYFDKFPLNKNIKK